MNQNMSRCTCKSKKQWRRKKKFERFAEIMIHNFYDIRIGYRLSCFNKMLSCFQWSEDKEHYETHDDIDPKLFIAKDNEKRIESRCSSGIGTASHISSSTKKDDSDDADILTPLINCHVKARPKTHTATLEKDIPVIKELEGLNNSKGKDMKSIKEKRQKYKKFQRNLVSSGKSSPGSMQMIMEEVDVNVTGSKNPEDLEVNEDSSMSMLKRTFTHMLAKVGWNSVHEEASIIDETCSVLSDGSENTMGKKEMRKKDQKGKTFLYFSSRSGKGFIIGDNDETTGVISVRGKKDKYEKQDSFSMKRKKKKKRVKRANIPYFLFLNKPYFSSNESVDIYTCRK